MGAAPLTEIMTDYNTDFALWTEDQAAKLRAGKVTELDRDNIAEELESLARALRRELVERLARLLQNLVQWDYLDGMRLPAWYVAIVEERGMIPAILKDAPSLRTNWSETLAEAWQEARERASGAMGLSERLFPETCPYSPSQALDPAFWPGEWNNKQEGPTSLERASRSAKLLANLGGTQPGIEGAPRRRFGALAGNLSVSDDFNAPLEIVDPTVPMNTKPKDALKGIIGKPERSVTIGDMNLDARPDMRTVTLGVDSRDAVSARFVSAMKGSAQGEFITFETPELLFQALTPRRWAIIKAVIGADPESIEELARRLRRDVGAVHDDVCALLDRAPEYVRLDWRHNFATGLNQLVRLPFPHGFEL
ncbi:DUF29 family protein [Paraburkholderia sp. BL10I2N1]|uniref:DUF29 family protein n=1 Tax=Paraburkholderia sp. BL10I2N1 TaxID=1938796 RepID=UPI00105ED82E|nr:DUF29 family protein [Paraburkholderia sp. BL10I2N1]TDN68248.1 uncharacterized protein DUF29 [Paraburkholderia sp. BL10I2N1]